MHEDDKIKNAEQEYLDAVCEAESWSSRYVDAKAGGFGEEAERYLNLYNEACRRRDEAQDRIRKLKGGEP